MVYGVGRFGALIAQLAVQTGWPIVAAFNRAGPKVGQVRAGSQAWTATWA